MMTNRPIEELRANTTNDCYTCTKDSKDCGVCLWRKK